MANQYLNMASKRSEDETDFTERDKKIALNAHFGEDSDVIEIKSPEYLKGKRVILKTYLVSQSLVPLKWPFETFFFKVILPGLLLITQFSDSSLTFFNPIFSFLLSLGYWVETVATGTLSNIYNAILLK